MRSLARLTVLSLFSLALSMPVIAAPKTLAELAANPAGSRIQRGLPPIELARPLPFGLSLFSPAPPGAIPLHWQSLPHGPAMMFASLKGFLICDVF